MVVVCSDITIWEFRGLPRGTPRSIIDSVSVSSHELYQSLASLECVLQSSSDTLRACSEYNRGTERKSYLALTSQRPWPL